MHWRMTLTWTDGRSTIELSDVQGNVPVDASTFATQPPAALPKR